MKRLLVGFAGLLLAVWLGLSIHADSGYVLVSYQRWTAETTLWFALLLMSVTFFLFYVLLRTLGQMGRLPERMRRWGARLSRRKADKQAARGMCLLAEGEFAEAERLFEYAARKSAAPLVHYLSAARAAQKLQAYDRRDRYLRAAAQSDSKAILAVGLTQAQLQLESEQLEQAVATLNAMKAQRGSNHQVLLLLKEVLLRLHDWRSLAQLSSVLRKMKVVPEEEWLRIAGLAYLHVLKEGVDCEGDVPQIWRDIPRILSTQPPLVMLYARYWVAQGNPDKAAELIEKTLSRSWYGDLVLLYSELKGSNLNPRIEHAQRWLEQRPKDPVLLHALGRLCASAHLWGQAREYLEKSLKLRVHLRVLHDLMDVLDQMGESDEAKWAIYHLYKI